MEFDWDRNNGRPTKKQRDFRKDTMERMADKRKRSKYFTPKEERIGKRIMDKWVKGERSLDDIDDVDINFSELKESISGERKFANVENDFVEDLNGNYYEVTVPSSCLPYLVNGDGDGYTYEEIKAMNDFVRGFEGKLSNGLNAGDCCIPLEREEPSFCTHNDVYGNVGYDCYVFCFPAAVNESKGRKKNVVKLTESQLKDVVSESVRALIGEGVYGYPDGIDTIILLSENDGELYKVWESIAMMVAKLAAKGSELSVEKLANSSTMKAYQQACFRKYAKEQETGFDPRVSPSVFRKYMAERMIDEVNFGEWNKD